MGAGQQALMATAVPGGGITDVTDDFNRTDSAVSLGTSTSGHLWTAQVGTWGINSNQGYCPTLSAGIGDATVDYGSIDCTLEVTFSTVARPMGVVLRWEDSSNYIRVRIRIIATVHRTEMHVINGGIQGANLISVDGVVWASGDVMKVVVSGQSLEVFRNGSSIGSITHTQVDDVTGTNHGIYTESTASRFDDFSITP